MNPSESSKLLYQGKMPIHPRFQFLNGNSSSWPSAGSSSGQGSSLGGTVYSLSSLMKDSGSAFEGYQKKEFLLEIERVYPSLHSRMLEFRLMDSVDPTFYLVCTMDSEEFQRLSIAQNILVTFDSFPSKVIDFVNLIQSTAKDPHPRYIAQLVFEKNDQIHSAKEAYLNIVETNSFKHIIHLGLKFTQASEEQLKRHLGDLNKSYRDELTMLKNRLSEVERSYHLRVQELVEEKERLCSEIERSKSSYADQLTFIRTNYASELGNERLAKALEELQVKFMREKSDAEALWKEKNQILNDRLAMYESGSSRTAMSDMMAKLKDTQNENAQLKSDLARMYMRDEHGTVSAGTNGLDRELSRLKERLRVAERETEEKEERIQRMRSEMKSYKELYEKLEDSSNAMKSQIYNLESSLGKATSEINKANEIIMKLQSELRASKSKYKSRISGLEDKLKTLERIEPLNESLSGQIDTLSKRLKENESELETLRKTKEKDEKDLKEYQNKLEANEKVIEWLHRQYGTSSLAGGMAAVAGTTASSKFKIPPPPPPATSSSSGVTTNVGMQPLQGQYKPKSFPSASVFFPSAPAPTMPFASPPLPSSMGIIGGPAFQMAPTSPQPPESPDAPSSLPSPPEPTSYPSHPVISRS